MVTVVPFLTLESCSLLSRFVTQHFQNNHAGGLYYHGSDFTLESCWFSLNMIVSVGLGKVFNP